MTTRPTTARQPRLLMVFRTPTGAIDLASIMVGVIVLAVIALGGVAATVFAVIPWAQNGAAEASLRGYQTAQSVAQAKDGRFMTTSELVDHGYLPEKARTSAASPAGIPQGSHGMSVSAADVSPTADDGPLRTALGVNGSCYVANLRSETGTVFYITSKSPAPEAVYGADPDTSWCVEFPTPAALTTPVAEPPVLEPPAALPPVFATVSAGKAHSMALDTNHHLWTWGSDNNGQLGNGDITGTVTAPAVVTPERTYLQVAAGSAHSVALDTDGHLWAWGANRSGQMGNGTTVGDITVPTEILPTQTFKQIDVGGEHTIALDTAGATWEWGYVAKSVRTTPLRTGTGPFTLVAAGPLHSLALDATGYLWSSGDDSDFSYRMGQHGGLVVFSPTINGNYYKYSQISAGLNFSIALTTGMKLGAWGRSSYGETGTGRASYSIAHDAGNNVPFYNTLKAIATGDYFSLALDSNKHLWSWGNDDQGQLGNGTATGNVLAPALVDSTHTFEQIDAGPTHALAVDSDGHLWSWGNNANGQLGNGTTQTATAPVMLEVPAPVR